MTLTVGTIVNNAQGDSTPHVFTLGTAVPVGASVIVFSAYSVSNENSNPVTDSQGNTYTQIFGGGTPLPAQQTPAFGHGVSSLNGSLDIWASLNISSALGTSDSISLAARPDISPVSNSIETVAIRVVSDAQETLALDQSSGTQTNFNTSHSSPSVTTGTATEIMFGAHMTQTGSSPWWTPGSGWSEIADRGSDTDGAANRLLAVQTRSVTGTGTFNSFGTSGANVYTLDAIVTFGISAVTNISITGVRASVTARGNAGGIYNSSDVHPSAATLIVNQAGIRW